LRLEVQAQAKLHFSACAQEFAVVAEGGYLTKVPSERDEGLIIELKNSFGEGIRLKEGETSLLRFP
jgi:hypothetical protein